MAAQQLKVVRAKRAGSYDGHRRRAGSEFLVDASANENWFEDVGPAPEGAELEGQIQNAQARPGRSFVQVMQELATAKPASTKVGDEKPRTLAEAAAEIAPPTVVDDSESLL